ncbi:hypothetical protein [Ktedonospora formicarum]|uniref:Uncharacterized protein n=1 Tax=Ktedonospora formicarum TaxID=2778364 RepID=A0A8J3HXL4_9CHLR|nr:hypothetical protein [Ktedonospora formicarum]GHO42788.1 hypothetical protein KSX_09510 [Ktedonospora formicarum]
MAGKRPKMSTGGPLEEGVAPKVGGVGNSGAHLGGMEGEVEGGEGTVARPATSANTPSERNDEDGSAHEHKPKHPSNSDYLHNPFGSNEVAQRGMAHKAGSGAAATSSVKMDKPGAKTSKPPKGESHDSSQTSGSGDRAPKGRGPQRGQRGSGNKATAQREDGARSQQTRGFKEAKYEGNEAYITDRQDRMYIEKGSLENALREQQNGNPVPLNQLREDIASTKPGGMSKAQAGRLFDNLTREYAGAHGQDVSSLTTENAASPSTASTGNGSVSTSTGGGESGNSSAVEEGSAAAPPIEDKGQNPPVEPERAPEVSNTEGGSVEGPHAAVLKDFAEKTGIPESEVQSAFGRHLEEGTITPKDLDAIGEDFAHQNKLLQDQPYGKQDTSDMRQGLRDDLEDLASGDLKPGNFLRREKNIQGDTSTLRGFAEKTGISEEEAQALRPYLEDGSITPKDLDAISQRISSMEADRKGVEAEDLRSGLGELSQRGATANEFLEQQGVIEPSANPNDGIAFKTDEPALSPTFSGLPENSSTYRPYSATVGDPQQQASATSSATAPASASNAAPSASSASGTPPSPPPGGTPPGGTPPPSPPGGTTPPTGSGQPQPNNVTLNPPQRDKYGKISPMPDSLQGRFNQSDYKGEWKDSNGGIGGPKYHRFEQFTVIEESNGDLKVAPPIQVQKDGLGQIKGQINASKSVDLNKLDATKGDLHQYVALRNDLQGQGWDVKQVDAMAQGYFSSLSQSARGGVNTLKLKDLPLHKDLQGTFHRDHCKSVELTDNGTIRYHMGSGQNRFYIETTVDSRGGASHVITNGKSGARAVSMKVEEFTAAKGDVYAFAQARGTRTRVGAKEFDDLYKNAYEALGSKNNSLVHPDNLHQHRSLALPQGLENVNPKSYKSATISHDPANGSYTITRTIEGNGKSAQVVTVRQANGNETTNIHDANGKYVTSLSEYNRVKGDFAAILRMRQRFNDTSGRRHQDFDNTFKALSAAQKGDQGVVNLNNMKNLNVSFTELDTRLNTGNNGAKCTGMKFDSEGAVFTMKHGDKTFYIHASSTRSGKLSFEVRQNADGKSGFKVNLDRFDKAKDNVFEYAKLRSEEVGRHAGRTEGDFDEFSKRVIPSLQMDDRKNLVNPDNLHLHPQMALPSELNSLNSKYYKSATITYNPGDGTFTVTQNIENNGRSAQIVTVRDANRNVQSTHIHDANGRPVMNVDEYNQLKNNFTAFLQKRKDFIDNGGDYQRFDNTVNALNSSQQGQKVLDLNNAEHLGPSSPLSSLLNHDAKYKGMTFDKEGITFRIEREGRVFYVHTKMDASGRPRLEARENENGIRGFKVDLEEFNNAKNNVYKYMDLRDRHASGNHDQFDEFSKSVIPSFQGHRASFVNLEEFHLNFPLPPQVNIPINSTNYTNVTANPNNDGTGTYTVTQTVSNGSGDTATVVTRRDADGNIIDRDSYISDGPGRPSIMSLDEYRVAKNDLGAYLAVRHGNPFFTPREIDRSVQTLNMAHRNPNERLDLNNLAPHKSYYLNEINALDTRKCRSVGLTDQGVDFVYHSGMGDIRVSVNRAGGATTVSPTNGRFSVRQQRMDEALRSGQSYRDLRDDMLSNHGIPHEEFDNFARGYSSIHADQFGRINLSDTSRKGLRKTEIMVPGKYGGAGGGHHQKMHHLLIFHAFNSLSHDYFALKKEELTGAVKIAETAAH